MLFSVQDALPLDHSLTMRYKTRSQEWPLTSSSSASTIHTHGGHVITDPRLAGGHDPRTIALLRQAFPDYWDIPTLPQEPTVVLGAARKVGGA